MSVVIAGLIWLSALLIGCTAPLPAAAPTDAQPAGLPTAVVEPTSARVPLVVFAAGSLIAPFDALETAFEAAVSAD